MFRRNFLKTAGAGIAAAGAMGTFAYAKESKPLTFDQALSSYEVRKFGAKGDGIALDTEAINRAIAAVNAAGGGTLRFPAGTYLSYSIHLKSNVSLYLDPGCVLLAASTPMEGTTSGGYDAAEPNTQGKDYQDFGHSHWHNSLIWGEGLQNVSILGPGLIWGKGLSRGTGDDTPKAEAPGVGNKAIALKNCNNVLLRDFCILKGGHFGILATGVDNLTIDNVKIDTNRDGMDIDCCRNVRVSNCSVNSPWDDGICPKSSFALGYIRPTENLTISDCYVTGSYELGSLIDGTMKRFPSTTKVPRTGRIKCGTESNGGFKNITVSNCVFDNCAGLALQSVDGALIEDVVFNGITMRSCTNPPIFMRLGARLRGPEGTKPGTLKRVIVSNLVSYDSLSTYTGGGIISGIPGAAIEDVKISDVYLHHQGGGTKEMAEATPEESLTRYPAARMFGLLPAHGFFVRHVKNIEFANVEIACQKEDQRTAFWMQDVDEADFFRIKAPGNSFAKMFSLYQVKNFRTLAARGVADTVIEKSEN